MTQLTPEQLSKNASLINAAHRAVISANNAELPLSVRMRAAIELLPFTHPKLAVVAQVTENDIATLLDRKRCCQAAALSAADR